jgi:hypothetical protein
MFYVRQWTIYNKVAHRRQHNLKTYWTIQCSRMLKYSIIHSSMLHWLFSLPERVLCEQFRLCQKNDEHGLEFAVHHVSPFFQSQWVWTFRVQLLLSSHKSCLVIASVSVAHFLRFIRTFMLYLCRIHREEFACGLRLRSYMICTHLSSFQLSISCQRADFPYGPGFMRHLAYIGNILRSVMMYDYDSCFKTE